MKAITLRNLPAEVDKAIRKRAKDARVSVNKAVIGLLEEHLIPEKSARAERYHDLDHLCGSWTASEAAAFERALDKQRAIRPIPTNDLWIAAIAMQYGLTVLTTDAHFKHVAQVLVRYVDQT